MQVRARLKRYDKVWLIAAANVFYQNFVSAVPCYQMNRAQSGYKATLLYRQRQVELGDAAEKWRTTKTLTKNGAPTSPVGM